MISLLSADNLQVNIAGIIVSGILSLMLLVVTIVNIVLNLKTTKTCSQFSIKTDMLSSILNFDSKFYNLCTKIVADTNANIDDKYVAESVPKLDDLNTELYETIIKVKNVFPNCKSLIEVLNDIYDCSEKLYLRMDACKDFLLKEIINAWVNIEDAKIEYDFLIKDLLDNENNYQIFTNGMSDSTKEFLDMFIKIHLLLEKINYHELMNA